MKTTLILMLWQLYKLSLHVLCYSPVFSEQFYLSNNHPLAIGARLRKGWALHLWARAWVTLAYMPNQKARKQGSSRKPRHWSLLNNNNNNNNDNNNNNNNNNYYYYYNYNTNFIKRLTWNLHKYFHQLKTIQLFQ